MTSAEIQAPAHPSSFGKIKMEDRKRSLVVDPEDGVSTRKRLLKDEHGQQMRMDPDKEKDVEVRFNSI